MHKTYPSKLLLFGEYSVIRGSKALAVPLARYGGAWDWAGNAEAPALQQDLPRFAAWLAQQAVDMDYLRFQEDLGGGLYFKSNIPTGYGLGSSGALVAAVYERYARNPVAADDVARLPALKAELAAWEVFFHASSSGIDPFISYVNRPVLLAGSEGVSMLPGVQWPQEFRFFLINTGKARQTGPLVQLFLEKCCAESFQHEVETALKPTVNAAIQAFLDQDEARLFACTEAISRFQLIHFREMIPNEFLPLWERSLEGDDFRMKLCGAGGGGFLLGLCRRDATPEHWLSQPWEWVV